jgi:phosphoribosylformylglycinamidine (FGAM) synthase PurS component
MNAQQYIKEVLGKELQLHHVTKQRLLQLPLYITETYQFLEGELYHKKLLFATPKDLESLRILQTEKQFLKVRKIFGSVVLLMPQITAYNRKRLIEKGINFVVPGKQLYLPDLLIDLRENDLTERVNRKPTTLLPSAQFLVIYHIIHRNEKWQMEDHPFKGIAEKTGYTAMAITKAIENLKEEEIVDVRGEKEKFIHFRLERPELWHDLVKRKLLVNPILKKVYFAEKPEKSFLLLAGTSALPEYSDVNPSRQLVYAIDKTSYYGLLGENKLKEINDQEGRFGLEVWKYNPNKLAAELLNDTAVVDPLSLYLSLQDNPDERIEMALDQIINKFIW